jgi:hypothetical protein
MPDSIPKLLSIALLFGVTSLFVLGHLTEARAQSALCPTQFNTGSGVATGISLQGGLCTNAGTNPNVPTGAFSGAAVATQALTELTQTTTQETVRDAQSHITDRREQEQQRCAEGFVRVDGVCQRIPSRVSEAEPVAAAVPQEEHVLKKAKKPKGVTVARKEAAAPARKLPYPAPPPPPPVAPIPLEPAVRIATWTQLYGDYEKRNAQGSTKVTTASAFGGGPPTAPFPLPLSVDTHSGTVGFQFGADATTRGVLAPDDGLITGLLIGYLSSNVTINTASGPGQAPGAVVDTMGVGSSQFNASLTGPTAGVYATYFNGGFSTDFVFKIDALSLNENFNELLSFTNPAVGDTPPPVFPISSSFSGAGSFSMTNATLAGNLNYRFILNPIFWVEPTVGAQYTHSAYGANAADFGLANGDLVMVQGGARFGATTLLADRVLTTLILTGLAYDDVLVSGGFIPGASFLANNLLAQSDQGFLRGRGILALNFDFGQGVNSFVQGEVRGGEHLFGAGGKAGIRVQW